MLHIAGQTAGPIGQKFAVDTHGWLGVLKDKKRIFFKKMFSTFFPWATPGHSASILNNKTRHSNLCSLWPTKRLDRIG